MNLKKLNPTRNLLLYTYLSVLFCLASQVDLNKMTTSAMENQEQRAEQFIKSAFGR